MNTWELFVESKVKQAILLILSEEKNLTTTNKIYPLQRMELRCNRSDSVDGTIKWEVNGNYLTGKTEKYNITNNGSGSTLVVNNASESDSGESCELSLYSEVLYGKATNKDSALKSYERCTTFLFY